MRGIRVSLVVTAAVAAFAIACARQGSGANASKDWDARASAVREQTAAHGQAIAGAATLQQVSTLEAQNLGALHSLFASMHDDMDAMEHSCGMGMMSNLAGAFDEMEQECEEHAAAMTSAGSMGAADGEESSHQDWIAAMLDSMSAMHETMTSSSACMGTMGGGGMGTGMGM